jgi:hypothetical protein
MADPDALFRDFHNEIQAMDDEEIDRVVDESLNNAGLPHKRRKLEPLPPQDKLDLDDDETDLIVDQLLGLRGR